MIVESSEEPGPNGPEAVHFHGVENVIATAAPTAQIVLVTQIYITRPEAFERVRDVIVARRRGEQALRSSGRPYVIVRPSWLTDEPGGQRAIRFEQGDAGEGEIARADVAAVVVAALGSARARGKTFEIYNQPGARRRRSGTPRSPCSPPTEEALDMAMQEATLHSDGLAPAGHLWLPEGKSAEPHLPAIALSGPMTAVKDQVTG